MKTITREQSDKLFRTITSNGCREMTDERFYQAITELNDEITDADKALVILKALHNIAHQEEQKTEGVLIKKDWDLNTLTLFFKGTHLHFGQMNKEDDEGFSVLINDLYRHFNRPAYLKL